MTGRREPVFPEVGVGRADTLLQPLSMRNAGERIAERLVTAIALGEFIPGQRLPTERELAARLSVSRSTVREATQRLAAAGYVTVRRGRAGGTFVKAGWLPQSAAIVRRTLLPSWERLERLLDYRQVIEQQIARTAAQRRSAEDIAAIEKAVADYAAAGADRESSRAADEALHLAIAGATRNPYLVDLSQRIRLAVSLGFGAEPYSLEIRQRALIQHPQLADAVIRGAAAEAADLAAEHFSLTESMLRDLVARVRRTSASAKRRPEPLREQPESVQ